MLLLFPIGFDTRGMVRVYELIYTRYTGSEVFVWVIALGIFAGVVAKSGYF